MAYSIFLGGKKAKVMLNGRQVTLAGIVSGDTRPEDPDTPTEEVLSAPTIELSGDTLTITATDERTESFAIFVDGVEVATVAYTIAFAVDGTNYRALPGMTWGEWCDSTYNTGGYYVDGGVIRFDDKCIKALPSDKIISGYNYRTKYLVGDIRFVVNDEYYYADAGMTWGEWVESEYNTNGWRVDGNNIRFDSDHLIDLDGVNVLSTDTIIDNAGYGPYSPFHSGGSN